MIIDIVIESIIEKKGNNIIVMDFCEHNGLLFDNFIICHGNSSVHIEAIVDNILYTLKKKKKLLPLHIEGRNNKEWVLMDYGDIIIHIFDKKSRDFFNLEDLWADALITEKIK